MAQAKKPKRHASAIKAQRQAERRYSRNRAIKKSVRLAMRAVSDAAKAKDANKVADLMSAAAAALDKAAQKGAIHWKTAARKKSRLAQRVTQLAGASA
ncbi:MAG: 30S ribosomal protein S20 [Elusimicrobia bacterium]|nr:30S ribosomal protein S20 [Elusimicrobiota bacterium]